MAYALVRKRKQPLPRCEGIRVRIQVVHALPRVSSAFGQDHDGFSAAIEVIGQRHDVDWVNVHPANPDDREQRSRLGSADFVLVRSDWGWYPDAIAGPILARGAVPCGLLIAGSHPPPSPTQALRYDVLFYESPWYAQFLPSRPTALCGIGVDARVMVDQGLERDIDWLMVGRLAEFKRPLRLLEKTGRRVVVGDLATADPAIRHALAADGVELLDHRGQPELAVLYNRAKRVLVPCELQGGGERAVLEGRACGCEIEIAADNPKLASLVSGALMTHTEYAGVLLEGIDEAVSGNRTTSEEKRRGERERRISVLRDKARRLPNTIRIRVESAMATFRGTS